MGVLTTLICPDFSYLCTVGIDFFSYDFQDFVFNVEVKWTQQICRLVMHLIDGKCT